MVKVLSGVLIVFFCSIILGNCIVHGVEYDTNSYMSPTDKWRITLEQIKNEKMKSGSKSIDLLINGVKIDFSKYGAWPIIKENRTLIPVRAIMEAMNTQVKWNEAELTVEINGSAHDTNLNINKINIKLKIGNSAAYVNGKSVKLDVAADIENGRTYVPLRFIAETFNQLVEWDAVSRTVLVEEQNNQEEADSAPLEVGQPINGTAEEVHSNNESAIDALKNGNNNPNNEGEEDDEDDEEEDDDDDDDEDDENDENDEDINAN